MHGVSISPVAFIIVQSSGVKLLPVNHSSSLDKLIDLVPDLIEKATQMVEKKINSSQKIVNEILIVKVNDDKDYDEESVPDADVIINKNKEDDFIDETEFDGNDI